MSGNFIDEMGRVWELPFYNQRICIECGKPFLIWQGDLLNQSYGMQNQRHKPFVYIPETYRLPERGSA